MARVIGILGTAHCGSTALGLMLGSQPDVAFVGESHWLAEPRDQWPGEVRELCRSCGDDCPKLTMFAKLAHALEPKNWWDELAFAYGANLLVSSDKRPELYDRLGVPDHVLILYRDPTCWAANWVYKHGNMEDPVKASRLWVSHYLHCLDWCKRQTIEPVTVQWESVVKNPKKHISQLCHRYGLGPRTFEGIEPGQHHVRGYPKGVGAKICDQTLYTNKLSCQQRRDIHSIAIVTLGKLWEHRIA
jgi:hypothetical protein